jgi:hypothetical protein
MLCAVSAGATPPPKDQGPRKKAAAPVVDEAAREPDFPRFTVDYGVNAGSSSGASYVELNIGLNWHWLRWLTWRNGGFYRFQSGSLPSAVGLDSSVRAHTGWTIGEASFLGVYAGPGYRFGTQSLSAPFGEAGIGGNFGPVHWGLGVKYMMYSLVTAGAQNEFQYGLSLSGGGGFSL